jgi:hypothetical protein
MALGLTQSLTELRTRKCCSGVDRGRRIRLSASRPSVIRVFRQWGILNIISQPYRPPRPVTGIALLFILTWSRQHFGILNIRSLDPPYFLPSIVEVIRSRTVSWVRCVPEEVWSENLKGWHHFEKLGVNRCSGFVRNCREWGCWLVSCSARCPVAGRCEDGCAACYKAWNWREGGSCVLVWRFLAPEGLSLELAVRIPVVLTLTKSPYPKCLLVPTEIR